MVFRKCSRMFLLMIMVLTSIGITVSAQSYKDIRIAYINVITEPNEIISDGFLARAKRNNYTHIMPLFYPCLGGNPPGNGFNLAADGSDVRYNGGTTFNSGWLYYLIHENIHKIRDYGFECIPFIDDGRIGWRWFIGSSIQFYNYTSNLGTNDEQLTACIAPGGSTLSTLTKAELTVLDFLRVVNAACAAPDVNYAPPYIHFGAYSETYAPPAGSSLPFGPGERLLWGGLAYIDPAHPTQGSKLSIDQTWMTNHDEDVVSMVFESMKSRLNMMHNLVASPPDDNKLENTKMLVYGDMFSPFMEESMGYSPNDITQLPQKVSDQGLQDEIIFMPWHYPDIYYKPQPGNPSCSFSAYRIQQSKNCQCLGRNGK